MWQAPHKKEQRSLQPGSARGHPSHENNLQPGSARGYPSQENHQGPKRPADTRRFRLDGALDAWREPCRKQPRSQILYLRAVLYARDKMARNGANAVVRAADGPGDRRGRVDIAANSNRAFHGCAIVVRMFEEGVERSENGGLDLCGDAEAPWVWPFKDVRREFGALLGNGLAR